MSRSVRKYNGLSHTWSDTKQGKRTKVKGRRVLRARLKSDFEANEPIGRKCHKCNMWDGRIMGRMEYADYEAKKKGHGYDPRRKLHKLFAK